jgi:hypothetical protein
MLEASAKDGPNDEAVGALADVFTTHSRSEADLFDFIAFAQGCHAAAEVLREKDDPQAGLYFAMGQDLLTKAAEAYAVLAADIARLFPKH